MKLMPTVCLVCTVVLTSPLARSGDVPIGQLRTFLVNDTADIIDADANDGACDTDTNPNNAPKCTLRAAIMQGNAYDPTWNIEVILTPATTYTLTLPGAAEQLSKTGDLDILRPMYIGIPGDSDAQATIDANELDRALHITGGGESQLSGIRIVNGLGPPGTGAGIHIEHSSLRAQRVHVVANRIDDTAGTTGGSAIELDSGQLTLEDSQVRGNTGKYQLATSVAGIFAKPGSSVLTDRSEISYNSGTGIFLWGSEAEIFSTTILRNYDEGIYSEGANFQPAPGIAVVNSTISGNSLRGVALFNTPTSIINSTIVGVNYGLYFRNYLKLSIPLTLEGNVVQAATDCIFSLEDESDFVISSQYNVFGGSSCIVSPDTGSIVSADLQLSEIGDWGGPTPTHRPEPASPAIDIAPPSLCSEDVYDQRGEPRPVAYNANAEPRCDAGAVELQPVTPPDPPWQSEVFLDGFEGN